MAMKPRIGQTLASAIDTTTVIVVRARGDELLLTCGGVEMVDPRRQTIVGDSADPTQMTGTLLGKRYAAEELGLEVLCTKAGSGALAANGRPLEVKAAKGLPASD
jgi:hypothetical protein